MTSVYDFSARQTGTTEVSLSNYRGKVLLVVNVASKCGFTPQYDGLQKLYDLYRERGFEILAFPCDQFAHQEPGSDEEIRTFCRLKYNVSFPLFSKIEVNGRNAHPLFRHLRRSTNGIFGNSIKWNFTKFLISRDGQTVKRYAPSTEPEALQKDIERTL